MTTRELRLGQQTLRFETGKLAKQADGSVIVRYGDSVVLVTACRAANAREGIDFLPLTVDYREYTYASGRIPGGFFKREGKPAEKEVLTSRVIDRPIRPLFPSGWRYETQIIALVLSADAENDTDVLAITGASAALALSDIPFEKTIAGIRVGLVDDQYVINPTFELPEGEIERKVEAKAVFKDLKEKVLRDEVLDHGRRLDGRKFDEIRNIWIETSVLPRTHGSSVFTRGETQALVTCTLGTGEDAQKIESFEGEQWKSFMLHYNFPPFSVGEVAFLRGPGRREVGHGALAERALAPMIPGEEQFPYTVRVVSDILESNGSSSMASVCGGALAMMDAGVPLKSAVAGIAMGLVMDEKSGKYAVLSDIAGAEDHYGDMDFKVAGTADGITALQMDIKVSGITTEVMTKALDQARQGRIHILAKMREALPASRQNISLFAPRIVTIRIPVDKIRDVIGPGGKMIRSIIERTGVKIDVEDHGRVNVASADGASAQKANSIIQELTATPELNKTYMGKVQRITDFGAFVEIMPGTDGLLHVSEIANHRVKDVRDELKEGEQLLVKVINIDPTGKIRLSRKALLQEETAKQGAAAAPAAKE